MLIPDNEKEKLYKKDKKDNLLYGTETNEERKKRKLKESEDYKDNKILEKKE